MGVADVDVGVDVGIWMYGCSAEFLGMKGTSTVTFLH